MSEGQYLYEDWLCDHAACDVNPCGECRKEEYGTDPDCLHWHHWPNGGGYGGPIEACPGKHPKAKS